MHPAYAAADWHKVPHDVDKMKFDQSALSKSPCDPSPYPLKETKHFSSRLDESHASPSLGLILSPKPVHSSNRSEK
jgi:hypothetical protein